MTRVVPDAELGAGVEQHPYRGKAVRDLLASQAGVVDVGGDDCCDERVAAGVIAGVDVCAEAEE
jgi:hypothetical protein